MRALSLRHTLAATGFAFLTLMTLSACAAASPTPGASSAPSAAGGDSSAGGSCAELYAVGQQLTEMRSCTVNGAPVSVGSYTCVGPERLGYLDSSAGLSQTVWFVVPGVVTAAKGSLQSDPDYVAAFTKCTGHAP